MSAPIINSFIRLLVSLISRKDWEYFFFTLENAKLLEEEMFPPIFCRL